MIWAEVFTMAAKCLVVLCIELILYYIIGTMVTRRILRIPEVMISMKVILGFLVYQICFQCFALPFIFKKKSLTMLTEVWCVVITLIVILSVIFTRKYIVQEFVKSIKKGFEHKWTLLFLLLTISVMFFFAFTQGQLDEDSRYYIGVVSTSYTTDTMFRFNVYTGEFGSALYLRRILVTSEINIAMLCKIFPGIHPIIMMRMFRAWLNIVLTANAIYLLGTKFWEQDERKVKKSFILVMLTYVCYFAFDGSIFSSATFMIHRGYEGKAFAGNVLAYFVLYLCISFICEKKKQYFVCLFITLWAAVAISSSAIFVCVAGCIILLITGILGHKLEGRTAA